MKKIKCIQIKKYNHGKLDSQANIGESSIWEPLKIITEDDIQRNSVNWGNYFNSEGGAKENSGDIQPGGTNECWKVNNIYNLAGNVREWTQEKYSTGTSCAYRAGNYTDLGIDYPAACRNSVDGGYRSKYIRL